jgi:hypothetical protein
LRFFAALEVYTAYKRHRQAARVQINGTAATGAPVAAHHPFVGRDDLGAPLALGFFLLAIIFTWLLPATR